MTTSLSRVVRLSFGAATIAGVAALAAFLPSAAVASAPVDTSVVSTQHRSEGAAVLGGWIGGGVLLFGTSVLVATTSVRQQRTRTLEAAEA